MFTPQQIEQISFGKATFGGYNMDDVDAFLEPLTEDYITLYKENALLKSKMRILVGKLEEYRKNEASMREAIAEAQQRCDQMVLEAQDRCAQMIGDANAAAEENTRNADALIAAENARIDEARRAAAAKIDEIEEQMRACIHALERIKRANAPANTPKAEASDADSVADQISHSLEALVGTTEETHPKAEPKHPTNDTTTSKFANLQFGRNYDPTQR